MNKDNFSTTVLCFFNTQTYVMMEKSHMMNESSSHTDFPQAETVKTNSQCHSHNY